MSKFFIPVIAGTSRPQRRSIKVANFIHDIANNLENVESVLVDPTDFKLPFDGNDDENRDPRYTEITAKADAFLVVVPEYNHSFPGSLKRLLDSELKNYIHKPIAFAGVANGPWGGVRAIESLIPVVRELGLVATFTDVQFPGVSKLFDDQGQMIEDQKEKYQKRVARTYEELLWMAETLKWGRENLKKDDS